MLVSQFLGLGLLPELSASASLHSASEPWSSAWGISTAWAGRSGVGPSETSTWVSVPGSAQWLWSPRPPDPQTTVGMRREDAGISGSEVGTWFWSCMF